MTDFEEQPLRALMVSYQSGRPEAFERLYAELGSRLRHYLGRFARDAARVEDLLQETFLQIHRARHTYDPRYPVEPWAFAIARHVGLMERRRRARRPEAQLADIESEPAHVSVEATWLSGSQLATGLASLNRERRHALVLHHVWGFSFREIGKRLGIAEAAARLRSSRGLASLRKALRGQR